MAYVASNSAVSTIATATISSSETTITVATGQGARFPTIPSGDYTLCTMEKADGTKEIICVVARAGDVLTVGTPASSPSAHVDGRNYEPIYGMVASGSFTTGDVISCRPTAATIAAAVNAPSICQPLDADLTAIAALTSAADKVPYSTGAGAWALATLTAFGRTVIAAADAAAAKILLGLTIGTDVQAYDVDTAKTDVVQTFTKAQRGDVVALTASGASLPIDLSLANHFSHTFTAAVQLAAPTNAAEGQSGMIFFTNHASTAYALTFDTFWKFGGGSPPTVGPGNNVKNAFTYVVADGATYAVCALIKSVS